MYTRRGKGVGGKLLRFYRTAGGTADWIKRLIYSLRADLVDTNSGSLIFLYVYVYGGRRAFVLHETRHIFHLGGEEGEKKRRKESREFKRVGGGECRI